MVGRVVAMRIALVYDCVYPATVGGAERWLRRLAEALREDHDVTYVTRRQWQRGQEPIPGVAFVVAAPGTELYARNGRRRLLGPTLFGVGTFLHFARHRNHYDVVHCLSYPFLPLIAVRVALMGSRTRVTCEWLECLTDGYWRAYGGVAGWAARALQRLCVRLTPEALVFSEHTARRLRQSGFSRPIRLLGGLAATPTASTPPLDRREPLVVFAGRHVPDKRATAVPDAVAVARRQRPDLRAVIAGDGPDRPRVLERIDRLGLQEAISAPGFVDGTELEDLVARASCVVAPSRRDGFGMVVAEAASLATPVVVCPGPDNAAGDRVVEGVNGALAADASPEEVGRAILRVMDGGEALRRETARWFSAHRTDLLLEESIESARRLYETASRPPGVTPNSTSR
jgi:glycosyltransferase involved in cell wall biosynthesis